MAWVLYNKWKQGQLDAESQPGAPIDFNTDTIKLLLVTAGNAPDIDIDQDVADAISGSTEVSGTNYARKSISSVTVSLNASTDTVKVDGNDPTVYTQSSTGFSDARYAVLFKSNSSVDANSPLIAYNDFGTSKGNVSGNLTLQFSASSGIFLAT